jgi:hypothetical protein
VRALSLLVIVAFLADGVTTRLAADLGHERNPLVPDPRTASYALSCVARCAIALALLRIDARRRVVAAGLGALVAFKLGAAASNAALALGHALDLSPALAPLGLAGALLGLKVEAQPVARELVEVVEADADVPLAARRRRAHDGAVHREPHVAELQVEVQLRAER